MYQEFYSLLGKPFSAAADASCFFMSKQHAIGLSALQYSVLTNAGLTLVTAEAGLGKTALIRRVMSNLDDSVVVGCVSNTNGDYGSIFPWILSAFELRGSMSDTLSAYEVLQGFLDKLQAEKKRAVIMIDEAQNLSNSALEEVRLLLNFNESEDRGLQVVLVGQPLLKAKLEQDSMRNIAQRISLDVALEPFDYDATDEYISYQLSFYGGKPEIFDYMSRATIFYHTWGIPRLINSVCDLAMVYGYGESLEAIDFRIIRQVLLSKKVGLNYFRKRQRSAEAISVHSAILASHNVDISQVLG